MTAPHAERCVLNSAQRGRGGGLCRPSRCRLRCDRRLAKTATGSPASVFQITGRPRIGLLRFYEPNLQRWINRDPSGEKGGVNLYGVVHSDPLNKVDSDGREVRILVGDWLYIGMREWPITCGNRIKNEVWEKFAPGGKVPPRDPNFHYGHCVAHCRIQRECPGGRFTSWAGGLGKEIWDEIKQHWHKEGPGYDGGDMDANREGRKRGRHCKEKSCEEACKGTEG